jgi:hypothetical protein
MMRHTSKCFRWFASLAGAVVLVAASSAVAAPTVQPGLIHLAPLAGQSVELHVTGGQAVQGMSLMVQIDDGTSGPVFQGADILTGTIFAGNNLGLYGGSYVDARHLYQGVITASGTVNASGLLGTLTMDASACGRGYYALKLSNELEQADLDFAGLAASLTDGVIFVPELGDADFSDTVDVGDLGILAGNWGATGVGWSKADFNGDDIVDVGDLGILAGHWGFDGSAVPEPASMAILVLVGGPLLRRRLI